MGEPQGVRTTEPKGAPRFDALLSLAERGISKIRSVVLANRRVQNGKSGWGEILNRSATDPFVNQVGIFGTSVALQALYNCGDSPCGDVCRSGLQWLAYRYDQRAADSETLSKRDFDQTLKMSFFLRAFPLAVREAYRAWQEVARSLMSARRMGEPWDFLTNGSTDDETEKILPTSYAVLALLGWPEFRRSDDFLDVVLWLKSMVPSLEGSRTNTGLLALALYTLQKVDIPMARPAPGMVRRLADRVCRGNGRQSQYIKKEFPTGVFSRGRPFHVNTLGLTLATVAQADVRLVTEECVAEKVKAVVENIEANNGYLEPDIAGLQTRHLLELSEFFAAVLEGVRRERSVIELSERIRVLEHRLAQVSRYLFLDRLVAGLWQWIRRPLVWAPLVVGAALTVYLIWRAPSDWPLRLLPALISVLVSIVLGSLSARRG
jgi:hypothetical protein